MTSTVPACKNCKHFQASRDEMFSTCDRYHYEAVDYLNGTVNRHNSIAFAMRDKEKFCGREGKNFEMKEFRVEKLFMPFANAIHYRLNYDDNIDRCAFFEEINRGWYEMYVYDEYGDL